MIFRKGDIIMAKDSFGRSYVYMVDKMRPGFRGMVLYNITIDDRTLTEVEKEWFKQREIYDSFDNYYFHVCKEMKQPYNISLWDYDSLRKSLFELNKKCLRDTDAYKIINREFESREKLAPSFWNTMWHDTSAFFSKEKFKKIDIYNPGKKVLGDVFVTVKFLDNKKIHGYAKLNDAMAEYFNQLIEFREESASINIIQWTDRFLMVFEDSMHISYRYAFLETEDALDFFEMYLEEDTNA